MKLRRPSASMCVALAALFLALAGTGYAALKLPTNSVGTKQLKPNSVTSAKIRNGAVTAAKIASGVLPASQVPQAPPPANVPPPTTAYLGKSSGPFSTSSHLGQAIIATVSLPSPGAYTLMADGFAYPSPPKQNADQVYCRLLGPGDEPLAGMPSQLGLDVSGGKPLVIVGAAELPQAGTVRMQCQQIAYDEPDTITYISGRIVATKVDSLVKG